MATQFEQATFGFETRGVIRLESGKGFKWLLDPVPSWEALAVTVPVAITGGPTTGNMTGCRFGVGFSNYAGDQFNEATPRFGFGMTTGVSAQTLTGLTNPSTYPTTSANYGWTWTAWATRFQNGAVVDGIGGGSVHMGNYDIGFAYDANSYPSATALAMTVNKAGGTTWQASWGYKYSYAGDVPDSARKSELTCFEKNASYSFSAWTNQNGQMYRYGIYDIGSTGYAGNNSSASFASTDEATYGPLNAIWAYWISASHPGSAMLVGRPVVMMLEHA